jgi:hypothetical protein
METNMDWLKTMLGVVRGSGWSFAMLLVFIAFVYINVPLQAELPLHAGTTWSHDARAPR